MLKARWLYRKFRPYRLMVKFLKATKLPLMGGLPLYDVIFFFIRNLQKESLNLRASSIAFNLFLSLFPSLIFLFTLLPYVPIGGLNKEILQMLQFLMPTTAFESIDTMISTLMEKQSGSLLSFGLILALFFGSNGVFSLIETFNKDDRRAFWKIRLIAIGLTLALGILVIAGLCLFLLTQLSVELLIYNSGIDEDLLYYILIVLQWLVIFILIFGAYTVLYRHGDMSSERWRYIYPGAAMASVLTVLISIAYAYYVETWANYNRFYGSLGAMIITMLWLYINSIVIIIGHDFNRSLIHTRLTLLEKEQI